MVAMTKPSNKGLELTAYRLRYAPASGSSSGLAFRGRGPQVGWGRGGGLDIELRHQQSLRTDYRSLITIEPGKRDGTPCIRGRRITVYDILDYLASGVSEAEILADFPDLTAQDIRACLAFAADRERRMVWIPPAA